MNIVEYHTSKEASGLIECFWYFPANKNLILFPDGVHNDLIGEVCLVNNQGEVQHSYDVLNLPLLRQTMLIRTISPVLVIRKKAFVHLSKKKSAVFTQSLRDYIGRPGIYLDAKRLDELTHDLGRIYAENYFRIPILTQLINEILFRKGQLVLSELYLSWNLSKQSVSKTYASKINMSLKELSNIWKLNNFLINLSSSRNLTSAFVDAGFFDQAHGTKYFKKYYNTFPSAFLTEHQDTLASIISPMQRRFDGFYDPVNS
jgi:AraC-like DNA-binding protein